MKIIKFYIDFIKGQEEFIIINDNLTTTIT